MLLHAFADLDADQIAALFNLKSRRVEARLHKLDNEPGAMLERPGFRRMPPRYSAGPSWRPALQQRYPAPRLEDDQVEALAVEIVTQAEKRNAIRRRWILLQELVLLAFAALVVAGLIMAADSITPGSATRTPPPTSDCDALVEREVSPVIVVITTATPGPPAYPTPSPVGRAAASGPTIGRLQPDLDSGAPAH